MILVEYTLECMRMQWKHVFATIAQLTLFSLSWYFTQVCRIIGMCISACAYRLVCASIVAVQVQAIGVQQGGKAQVNACTDGMGSTILHWLIFSLF